MINLERQDDVFVLSLGTGDNRFSGETVPALSAVLDELEATTGPAALVTTATGKIWSNGLDLDYMGTLDGDWAPFLLQVESVLGRFMKLPMLTVAAIQGHAFAAGAMFALAHDVRIMRSDRGYFCLPEVDLGIAFTEGMAALIQAKLSQPALHRVAVLGERLPAPVALELGVINGTADDGLVFSEAMTQAAGLASKAKPEVSAIRRNFYGKALEALDPQ